MDNKGREKGRKKWRGGRQRKGRERQKKREEKERKEMELKFDSIMGKKKTVRKRHKIGKLATRKEKKIFYSYKILRRLLHSTKLP